MTEMKNDLHVFEMRGTGRVIADLSRDDLPPVIQFEDGTHAFGLPRSFDEVSPMGYESTAEANFVHEALHMFIASKCNFTPNSILYRAGHNADFSDPEILEDAKEEERIVLGLQIAVNDAEGDSLTSNKIGGFVLHIAAAARKYSEGVLRHKYGLEAAELKEEFLALLHDSGCFNRVMGRKPRLIFEADLIG